MHPGRAAAVTLRPYYGINPKNALAGESRLRIWVCISNSRYELVLKDVELRPDKNAAIERVFG